MNAVGIIPARYQSTRLPGKLLLCETGRPLIQHVWERAAGAPSLDQVIIATDDERIRDAAAGFGAEVRMTSPAHPTGTDRIAEVAADLDHDIVVNIQGDEPEIEPDAIDAAVRALVEAPQAVIATLACPTKDPDRAADPNAVKVVCGTDGRALYFSRAPIPHHREPDRGAVFLIHVGLYAYRREFLLELAHLPQTPLEQAEKLEQLRTLEHGRIIQVAETAHPAVGVDTPADYREFVRRYQQKGPTQ